MRQGRQDCTNSGIFLAATRFFQKCCTYKLYRNILLVDAPVVIVND